MDAHIRYYALVGLGGTLKDVYNIFREVRADRIHFLERLDPKNPNRWVRDSDLGVYIFKGEPGAEPITEAQAREIVERKGGIFSPPKIEP